MDTGYSLFTDILYNSTFFFLSMGIGLKATVFFISYIPQSQNPTKQHRRLYKMQLHYQCLLQQVLFKFSWQKGQSYGTGTGPSLGKSGFSFCLCHKPLLWSDAQLLISVFVSPPIKWRTGIYISFSSHLLSCLFSPDTIQVRASL